MGKVITIQFRRCRLPLRLLKDGWWLDEKTHPSVIVFPQRRPPEPNRARTRKGSHLTLIISRE